MAKFNLTSFENASIIRKMTILYFLMSILPVGVLYYLYLMVQEKGRVTLDESQFALVLGMVVIGVAVGYFALRSLLLNIVAVTNKNAAMLTDILGKDKVQSISLKDTNEIALLARSFNEITAHLEENVRNLELAKKTLHSVLAKIGEGISTMENIDAFLDLIVQTTVEALDAKAGFLFLIDEERNDFNLKSIFGFGSENLSIKRIYGSDPLFQKLREEHQPLLFDRVKGNSSLSPVLEVPALCAPLILHEDVLGALIVSGRVTDKIFDDEEKGLLYNLALQTAVAVENSRLNEDAERTYFETVSALAMAVEAKDPYSRGHSERVANLCVRVATEMNLPKEEVIALRDAAKLHDLGKIGVMDDVLTKNGPLNKEETLLMRKHPIIGESIIKPIHSLENLCDLIRHHHEKLDGSGYPDGLKGDQISLQARILGIADIFDALTSDRPYRKALTSAGAINQLRGMAKQVDQRIVDVFQKVI